MASRDDTARDFLSRFVVRGAGHWQEAFLESEQAPLLELLPPARAAFDGQRDDPAAFQAAIEAAVHSSADALTDPQRSAALAYLGLSREARGKSEAEREKIAARWLRGTRSWFRTASPSLGGMEPREWLLDLVAAHLASGGGGQPVASPPDPSRVNTWPEGQGQSFEAEIVRSLDWEGFYSAVAELGRRVFADSAYGGFWPDAVVGVNHGGAIVAGLLFYAHSRSFEIFTMAARENDFVSSPTHLASLAELADRHRRQIRVLLVDDSMKSGGSLRLARKVVREALAGREAVIRTAVLVYRRDYHLKAENESAQPDEHVYLDIDHFPYGAV